MVQLNKYSNMERWSMVELEQEWSRLYRNFIDVSNEIDRRLAMEDFEVEESGE